MPMVYLGNFINSGVSIKQDGQFMDDIFYLEVGNKSLSNLVLI